jgi:hypothetical protein
VRELAETTLSQLCLASRGSLFTCKTASTIKNKPSHQHNELLVRLATLRWLRCDVADHLAANANSILYSILSTSSRETRPRRIRGRIVHEVRYEELHRLSFFLGILGIRIWKGFQRGRKGAFCVFVFRLGMLWVRPECFDCRIPQH